MKYNKRQKFKKKIVFIIKCNIHKRNKEVNVQL